MSAFNLDFYYRMTLGKFKYFSKGRKNIILSLLYMLALFSFGKNKLKFIVV